MKKDKNEKSQADKKETPIKPILPTLPSSTGITGNITPTNVLKDAIDKSLEVTRNTFSAFDSLNDHVKLVSDYSFKNNSYLDTINSSASYVSNFVNLNPITTFNASLPKMDLISSANFLDKTDPWISFSSGQQWKIEEDLVKKKQELDHVRRELLQARDGKVHERKEKERIEREFIKLQKEYEMDIIRKNISDRISTEGRKKLIESNDLLELFSDSRLCEAVVLSIDIRKSTQLMLQAREPRLFAEFITQLSRKLSDVVVNNYGVFDKFTGDGILAFFPTFYSGKDAMLYALKAAEECHKVFEEHYNNSRHCFNIFIKGKYGLGIGIDYGAVTLFNEGSSLTIVGIPVVYACRLSSSTHTLLNQPAREQVEKFYPSYFDLQEFPMEIKHEEGCSTIGYRFYTVNDFPNITPPNWEELILEFKSKRSD